MNSDSAKAVIIVLYQFSYKYAVPMFLLIRSLHAYVYVNIAPHSSSRLKLYLLLLSRLQYSNRVTTKGRKVIECRARARNCGAQLEI